MSSSDRPVVSPLDVAVRDVQRPAVHKVRTILVDLDDTLCDTTHRHHLLGERGTSPSGAQWDEYHLASAYDDPIWWTLDLVKHWAPGYFIHLVSGRGVVAEAQTVAWLRHYRVPHSGLHLRSRGDHRRNPEFKVGVAAKLQAKGHEIALGLDDHPGVIQAYGEIGIPGLLVRRPESKNWDTGYAF